jgi:16S rRNA (guanine1207-N2)-methyltransferase
MLLEALQGARVERALDVGCGNGLIGAWLTASGADVACVDTDAFALEAARLTLAQTPGARVFASDVYSDVEGPFTHIVTNPPFHAGVRTTSEVSQRLIREAPDHLARGGELWLVSNRFLPYASTIEETFGAFTIAAEDSRYRVYRARR